MAPLVLVVIVADAKSAPVGKLALVARTETVTVGAAPEHTEQKRFTSACTNCPVTAGIKVWPDQAVVEMPLPLVPRVVFCWSRFGVFTSVTLPALVVKSTFVGMPVWKSSVVVSVRQALAGAVASEKFCIVVLPSVTTMLLAVLEIYPAALAVMVG